jgi:hypothetical protein
VRTKLKRPWKLILNVCLRNYYRILFPMKGSSHYSANRDLNFKTLLVSMWTFFKNTSLCFFFMEWNSKTLTGGLQSSRCSASRQDSRHLMLQVIESKEDTILRRDSMLNPLSIPRLLNTTEVTTQEHWRPFYSWFPNAKGYDLYM